MTKFISAEGRLPTAEPGSRDRGHHRDRIRDQPVIRQGGFQAHIRATNQAVGHKEWMWPYLPERRRQGINPTTKLVQAP